MLKFKLKHFISNFFLYILTYCILFALVCCSSESALEQTSDSKTNYRNLQAISILEFPSISNYTTNQTFDPTGLKVSVMYTDGFSKTITYPSQNLSISIPNMTTSGYKLITVTYTENSTLKSVSTDFDIFVNEPTKLSYISILEFPYVLNYTLNQTFSAEGLKILVVYTDYSSKTIDYSDSNLSISTPDMTTVDSKLITVTYTEDDISVSDRFYIYVDKQTELSDIAILKYPSDLYYTVNQDFDPNGLKILVMYTDGTQKKITYPNQNLAITLPDMTTIGEKQVTLTYTEESISISKTYPILVIRIVEPEMIAVPGENFSILNTEVTQKLYTEIMGINPSNNKYDYNPVEMVSYYDAIYFCNKLSEHFNLTPVYSVNNSTDVSTWGYTPHSGVGLRIYEDEEIPGAEVPEALENVEQNDSANGFRLPKDFEWNYAAAGGEDFIYSGSNDIDEVAWCTPDDLGKLGKITRPVGQKKANGYGLYDMSGNVFEWTWQNNEAVGHCRYVAGGAYRFQKQCCQIRNGGSYQTTSYQGYFTGFRVVRNN